MDGPVGNAEACPALPKHINKLTDAQDKRAAKTLEAITSYLLVLAELIDEAEKEAYIPTFRRFSCRRQRCSRPPLQRSRRSSKPCLWWSGLATSMPTGKEVQPAPHL